MKQIESGCGRYPASTCGTNPSESSTTDSPKYAAATDQLVTHDPERGLS